MHLLDIIEKEQLQYIQDLFSKSTGLAVICIDLEGNYLTTGSNFTDFCMNYIRKSPEGLKKCQQCDRENKGVYKCHAGLMDFSLDLIIEDRKMGSIIGGQILPTKPKIDDFKILAKEFNINEQELIIAINKIPVRTEEQIKSSAQLLGSMMNELINLEYFKLKNINKIKKIDEEKNILKSLVKEIENSIYNLNNISQTEYIIAINASIEANKAGVYASGFSVVAREMKELATISKQIYGKMVDKIDNLKECIERLKD